MPRQSWLSEEGDEHFFRQYLERLEAWQSAFVEENVTLEEIRTQSRRVADLLCQVERALNEEQHALVGRLLLELAVLNALQSAFLLQNAANLGFAPKEADGRTP